MQSRVLCLGGGAGAPAARRVRLLLRQVLGGDAAAARSGRLEVRALHGTGLYILAFIIIMVGFILYCSTPTQTAEPAALPQPSSTGLDNAALKLDENDSETPAITVQFTSGEAVVVST